MQKAISTDTVVMNILDTLMRSMNTWEEQERLNQVKMALYMNLMDKTIISNEVPGQQLPTEYIDDTPHVIEMWLRCLRLEKRTENTIKSYRGEVNNLYLMVRKHYADITTNDIRGYLSWRQITKGNSDTTINNKIHVFQSFYGWIMREDLEEDGGILLRKPKKNPMDKINIIKTERKVKTVLTDRQIEIIRCGCTNIRDRAIVEVLIATGMRVSELVGLDLEDVDINSGKCIVYGKGRKERPAFFTGRAIVHVQEYMKQRRQIPGDCRALFLNSRQSPEKRQRGRMSTDTIRHMLKRLVHVDERLQGINLHPHMFRSYLATYMSRHGAPVKDIQRILGHSNVNTTLECYIVEDAESAREAHSRFAP